ncbi:hypothetical protein [Luteibacter yeojuensis]|uniref:hypothetical protein n=1 Tax=Luteibacter yeojuensis TaxID=345309 RepID=UPI000AE494C2|nr:hypothetical protein [Luteibacter yeojuensis]
MVLQVKAGGEWIDIATGAFIHKPQLGPGSYRLVLQNISAAVGTITYTVRYRISGG